VYLWHYLFATWLNPLSSWISIPVGVTASLAVAWLSWRFVEAPSLQYAKRFRPVQRRALLPPQTRAGTPVAA
jgi:peptidoglycan/LPS O-acetylase OafA/YrhL